MAEPAARALPAQPARARHLNTRATPHPLRPHLVQVGLLETREVPERRSGVEAWSLRLASSLVELPFGEFVSRYEGSADGGIPFHRIAWFRQAGAVVW